MAESGESRASLLGAKLGNYAVQALVGRGAMGAVYLARDRSLGRPVALKVLLGSLARNNDQVRRFLREARATAPLIHPNIVRIYDAGIRDGVPYIAMEYIEGEPLDRFLARTGALEWHYALHIIQQVAMALGCAHAAGVVHRDVKPANILIDAHGRVRLTDFGIARILDRQGSGFTTHECMGTPEYMSPELCAGEKVGRPADLFSLGVTLFYMLAGRMPFHGDSHVALVQCIANDDAPRLNRIMPGVPDDVARLVAHLLEKDPTARPESAAAVVEQIERLQRENGGVSALPEALQSFIQEEAQPRQVKRDTPVPAGKKRRGPRLKKKPRSRRYSSISSTAQFAAAGLLLAGLAGLSYWYVVRPAVAPPKPPAFASLSEYVNGDSSRTFPLPARHWRAQALRWTPGGESLLVEAQGAAGTRAHGARGLLLLNPGNASIESLSPPSGPLLDSNGWVTDTPLRFARDGRFAVARPGKTGVPILAQRWTEAYPRGAVLAEFSTASWHAGDSRPFSGASTGEAILCPTGERLCALLYDDTIGGNYISELSLKSGRSTKNALRLTQQGATIRPGSLRYTPTGEHIAYVREQENDQSELWLVASGGTERDGQPIAIGHLGDSVAFNPEATRAVVEIMKDGQSELVLVRTDEGEIEAQLGPGSISDEAWHPSGSYLLARDYDEESGQSQLWAIEATPPYRRQRVTSRERGVAKAASVSPDGRWAAATTTGAGAEDVLLIDLTRTLFAGAPARNS